MCEVFLLWSLTWPELSEDCEAATFLFFEAVEAVLRPAEALAVIVFHGQLSFHLPNRVASSLIIVALGPLRTLQFRCLMISPCLGAKLNWEMLG